MPNKILCVAEDPKLEAVMRQWFEREVCQAGFELSFALNSLAAIDKLQSDPQIDVVLSDINMPEMNGLTLLSKLQKLKSSLNPVLTIIVISTHGDIENIRKAMHAGAYDFLTKPINIPNFRQIVAKALQSPRLRTVTVRRQLVFTRWIRWIKK